MNIGEKIKKARIDKKMSQRELGSKLNMTGQAISKIELGDSSPSIDTLKSICKELGINSVSLIDNTVLTTAEGIINKKSYDKLHGEYIDLQNKYNELLEENKMLKAMIKKLLGSEING